MDSANMLRGSEDRDAQIHGVGDQFVMT